MIMIRSNPGQKINKPPPPVPPRPSKSLVQEALAKTRHANHPDQVTRENKTHNDVTVKETVENKTNSPTRSAPLPPFQKPTVHEISKSNSCYAVNVMLKKPIPYERSISEDKQSSRPIVYQSKNCNRVTVDRKQSLKENTNVKIVRSDSLSRKSDENVTRNESFNVKNNRKSFAGGEGKIEGKFDGNFLLKEKKRDSFEAEGVDVTNDHSTLDKSTTSSKTSDCCDSNSSSRNNSLDKKWDKILNDRNHVNTLIDEMFASVLEVSQNTEETPKIDVEATKIIINNDFPTEDATNAATVIVIKDETSSQSNSSTAERKVKFSDRMNHELLIEELQTMKMDQEKILKRQRKPSVDVCRDKIQTNDWLSVSDSGEQIKMSACQITIEDGPNGDEIWDKCGSKLDCERISKMSHLHGLPPLPKSLSGFSLLEHQTTPNPPTPIRSSSMRQSRQSLSGQGHAAYSPHPKMNGEGSLGRKTTNLDTQLAILRREMYSLRQQDLSLLSQLWSLNESIQDFRQILQDQEDRVLSPPSPSPTPSSGEDEEYYMSTASVGFRPPSGLPQRRLSGSSVASGSVG